MIPETDSRWMRPLLRPAENVLWYGKPAKIKLFSVEDIFMIPFSLVWCGFVWFAVISLLRGDVPWAVAPFFIPFVIAALYLLPGRFVVRYLQQRNLQYALTSQRLIQKQGKKLKTVELDQLPIMNLELNSDGSGTIFFGTRGTGWQSGFNRRYETQQPLFELRQIQDANRVGTLIQNAKNQLIVSREEG